MVKIISLSGEVVKRDKLFSVLESITLNEFPNAVVKHIPQCEIGMRHPEREFRLSIYTKGNDIYPERVKNAVDVELFSGIPQLSIESIEAYADALKLGEAYERETKKEFELLIP